MEDDLNSSIILHCLKDVLKSSGISSDLKMKVLSEIYKYSNNLMEKLNPLGLGNDIDEVLTPDEVNELRTLILREIKKFSSLCKALRDKISPLDPEDNYSVLIEELRASLSKEYGILEDISTLEKKMDSIQHETSALAEHKINDVICGATKLLQDERLLLEEVSRGAASEKADALQYVKNLLEEKVNSNNQAISELECRLSDYKL